MTLGSPTLQSSTGQPQLEVKLFIGNLPWDASEAELAPIFQPFGKLVSVCMLGSGKSRSGHACAFVIYISLEAANSAVRALDGIRPLRPGLENPPMQVRIARNNNMSYLPAPTSSKKRSFTDSNCDSNSPTRKRSITDTLPAPIPSAFPVPKTGFVKFFIGCLPADASKAQLSDLFTSLNLPLRPDDGIHLMPGRGASGQACAFVHVAASAAAEVTEKINGKVNMNGFAINARVANSQEKKKSSVMPSSSCPAVPLFPTFSPQSSNPYAAAYLPGGYQLWGGYGESQLGGRFAGLFTGYPQGSSYGKLPTHDITGGYRVVDDDRTSPVGSP
jgi:RNA recognition motif-containing protein